MKKILRIVGILLIILGILLLFTGRRYVIRAFSKPIDIVEEGMDAAIPDKAVETDLELNMICERFYRQDNRDYHAVWVWTADNNYFIPISILSENAEDFNKPVRSSMDWAYGDSGQYRTETAHFQGVVVELDDITAEKMKDWFRETGLIEQESDMDKVMLPYMLYQVDLDGVKQNTIAFAAIMFVGFVLLCVGIFAPFKVYVYQKLQETSLFSQ